MQTLPRLRTDLIIREIDDGVMVKDPITGDFFKLDHTTGDVLVLFDNKHDIEDLAKALDRDIAGALDLVNQLEAFNFFHAGQPKKHSQTWHYMLWPVLRPAALLNRLKGLAQVMYSRPGMAVQICVAVFGISLFLLDISEITKFSESLMNPMGFLALWLGLIVIGVVHEFGHALALTAFGGTVPEMGVILLMLMPGFYTDVSDSYLLKERWKRVVVLAAGPVLELVFWTIAVVAWLRWRPQGFGGGMLFGVVAMGGLRGLLFNLNPLLRTDGYYILEEALGITNLYEKAFIRRRHGWFRFYALLSGAYSVFLIAFSLWAGIRSGSKWVVMGIVLFLAWMVISFLLPGRSKRG